jgi:hypothetical protein
MQPGFNAKSQRGQPQPNFHHEGHEDHEEKSYNLSYSILRVLRALRGEKVLSEMSEFGILHCRERREKAGNKVRHAVLLRDLCACAHLFLPRVILVQAYSQCQAVECCFGSKMF